VVALARVQPQELALALAPSRSWPQQNDLTQRVPVQLRAQAEVKMPVKIRLWLQATALTPQTALRPAQARAPRSRSLEPLRAASQRLRAMARQVSRCDAKGASTKGVLQLAAAASTEHCARRRVSPGPPSAAGAQRHREPLARPSESVRPAYRSYRLPARQIPLHAAAQLL
jgi:hypothetical protein